MALRERSAAQEMVAKHTAAFRVAQSDAPLMPTAELSRRLRDGGRVVLVDVRTPEEQKVSMIPSAVTRQTFESEVLPALRASPDPTTVVVPYCTVGYRSGLYCRELKEVHGISNVHNGEGVIMWTFDGGRLVRPLPGAAVTRAPSLQPETSWAPETQGDTQNASSSAAVYGKARVADAKVCEVAEVTQEVHVYGKPWNCAAEGYTTVYFSNTIGVLKFVTEKMRSKTARTIALWVWALMHFYLFFTPMCGIMYQCGCVAALSKWGQVKDCNVFDDDQGGAVEVHRCPWCSCSGLSCLFVSSDAKAFRGVFLFDNFPDGTIVTILTVLALKFMWRRVDLLRAKFEVREPVVLALKAGIGSLWFVVYCLVLGGIFFAASADYPYFLGIERESQASEASATTQAHAGIAAEVPGRLLVNSSHLWAHRDEWVLLDARAQYEAAGGMIPGAALVPWEDLAEGGAPPGGRKSLLRAPAEVMAILAGLGVNGSRPVAMYGAWEKGWGEEGRLLWSLHYLGFALETLACLDGGVDAWSAAGFSLEPLTSSTPRAAEVDAEQWMPMVSAGYIEPQRRATTEVVLSFASRGQAVLLDTRERTEYDGGVAGDAYGAVRSGHIPGAVAWPWRENIFSAPAVSGAPPALRTCEEIRASLPPNAASMEVIAYCTGGIRSGFVYVVLRGCGFQNVRNYDGSWWAWAANSVLPCVGDGPGCSAPGETTGNTWSQSVAIAPQSRGGSGRLL